MLHINDLVFRFGDRLLYDNATLHIPAGRKVGLVGRNGVGKSTLISLILGDLAAESGDIRLTPGARIGHVRQEAPDDALSVLGTVLAADGELSALEDELNSCTDPNRIAEIHTRLADIDAHSAEARAAKLLAGLGFDEEMQARAITGFSGGWRMRVALASTLFLEPDLLLLDEPTNYLDLEGVMWLETYLQTYPYTVLLISHDRDLLNKAVTHIVNLENARLKSYTGGYDRFETMKRDDQARQLALKSKQEDERRRLQDFADRFRAKATKAKQAQSRLKMLAKMQPIAAVVSDHTHPFTFPKAEPLSSPLIALESASVGYGDATPILSRLDLRIDMDDRIALLGANGNGKSTLAKLLSERLKPQDGKMRRSRKLKVAYFAQHQLDELRGEDTPFGHIKALMDDATEAQVRARLGGYGFGIEKADRKVKTLSGGEKARLMMAIATFDAPHLLILDEPTNHLDIDSREALAQGLNSFDGAVILISHDRHLVNSCADRLWLVEKGDVVPFDGSLDEYRVSLLETRRGLARGGRKPADTARKDKRVTEAQKREALAPLKQKLQETEAKIAELEALKQRSQEILADKRLYAPENKAKLQEIMTKSRQIDERLDQLEDRWLELSENLQPIMRTNIR